MIDISHESLMRIWVRLKNWVDDEADAVQMYLRLAEAATQYQVGKAGLWRPPDLQLALNWQAKHRPTLVWGQRYNPAFERTMIFLEYSKKEWETEQRIKELERAVKQNDETAQHYLAGRTEALQQLAAARKDAEIGRIVWKFIDRMNDVDPDSGDGAERILNEFIKAIDSAIDSAIAAHKEGGK